jgi:hypothetical protein
MQRQASFFSDKSFNDRYEEWFKKIISLDDREKKAFGIALARIKAKSFDALSEVVSEHFDRMMVFKLSENKDETGASCKDFLQRDDLLHCSTWSNELKDSKNIFYKITSSDNVELSIFDLYIGATLLEKSGLIPEKQSEQSDKSSKEDKLTNNAEALYWLHAACEKSSFHALIIRCRFNRDKLNFEQISTPEKARIVLEVFEDAKKLGKFYSSTGYLHAAMILFDIHNHYKQHKDEASLGLKNQFYLASLENFLCAKELEKYKNAELDKNGELKNPWLKQDEDMIKVLTQEKGLKMFEETWGSNMQELEKEILKDENDTIKKIHQIAKDKIAIYMQKFSSNLSSKVTSI